MRHFACHSCEFHVSFPLVSPYIFLVSLPASLLTPPSMPLVQPASASTPAAPSFPVFEFDFSTIQSRYVVITVFYTYELPYCVNRDHLRASTSARYTLDGVFASTKSRNDGGCSRRCDRIYDTRLFPVASLLDETYSQI